MTATFERISGTDITIDKENTRKNVKYRLLEQPPVQVGGDYFNYVASLAMAWITQFAATELAPDGTSLHWNNIQVQEERYAMRYSITVEYGTEDKQSGAYQITFGGGGGTVHVTAGTRIAGYGADVKDNGGLIGVDGDEVKGVDIPVAEPKISVTYRHPAGMLNRAYAIAVQGLIGYPNNDTFLGFKPGEVMLLDPQFTESDTEASASYSFSVSFNRENFVVGGITVVEKKGWDILSPQYEAAVDGAGPVRNLKGIEIIRPAGRVWKDYIPILGWGG